VTRSPRSKLRHSREPWKHQARQRADDHRYLRTELARIKRERDQHQQALSAAEARLHAYERAPASRVVQTKAAVIELALQLFLEARLSFRAVSRALKSLADVLGLKRPPCPHSVINWGRRLSLVRLQSAALPRGSALRAAPFANGWLWLIDIRLTLGAGTILAL